VALSQAQRTAALRDPAYHRYLMFGKADAALERTLGRPLEYHERQAHLPWPQRQAIDRCERAVYERNGEDIAMRFARQGGKNETEGLLEARMMSIFARRPGSRWIRVAPTYSPQLVNSKHRLEKFTRVDPLLRARPRGRQGGIVEYENVQIQFLSAGPTANVVGATASLGLSVDEAHKISPAKFLEDMGPFTASTNAPTILWGVAAAKQDLLYEHVERLRGTDRLLEFPAAIWADLSKAYAAHYEGKRKTLGGDHPIVRTQYDLIDIEAIGGYLNSAQRAALFSGDHPRLEGPRRGMHYAMVVDIGGESEVEVDEHEIVISAPGRDATVAWILEWDPTETFDVYPVVRIVAGQWWVGASHLKNVPELCTHARHWDVGSGVCDARGVGEAVAMALHKEIPAIEAYMATSPEVSADCYDLLARLNKGTVKMWRADPAEDQEHRELGAQSRHTRYEIRAGDKMALCKPTGIGSSDKHIDGIKALTYIHRAIGGPAAGTDTEELETPRGVLNPFEGRRERIG